MTLPGSLATGATFHLLVDVLEELDTACEDDGVPFSPQWPLELLQLKKTVTLNLMDQTFIESLHFVSSGLVGTGALHATVSKFVFEIAASGRVCK